MTAVAGSAVPETASAASTPESSALLGVYKRPPMEIVGGTGVFLFDRDGRRYLDFVAGIAVNALGYGDAELVRVLQEAASGLIHTSNLYHTGAAQRLAQRLVELSFADRVFFCNSGAEANEGAFKFVRKWARARGGPAKYEIVALRGSFHGRLFASVAATDRPAYRVPFRPLAGGISIAERDLRELDARISRDTTAAVIVEPVQGEGGVRVLDTDFLRELRELTRSRGVALILDEVQCGLGRTGTLFAYEATGIEPDVVTLAKPLAGGLPMGAVLLTEEIAGAMQPGEHGTTFGGGPFVSTVALHVLDRIADPGFLQQVRERGEYLGERLRVLMAQTHAVRDVRGCGLMWGVDLAGPAAPVVARARDLGLLVCTAGEHTLRLLPPLVITRSEIDEGLGLLLRAIG